MLAEELGEFWAYFEVEPAKAAAVVQELEAREFITTKGQLFRLEDKAWKQIALADRVVRDCLEAWVNDAVKRDAHEDMDVGYLVDGIRQQAGWGEGQLAQLAILLSSLGITKLKHLRYVKKNTLFKLGLPVLLVQELRSKVKAYQPTGGLGFILPIVGDATLKAPIEHGMQALTLDRAVQQVGGKRYEYDRKCPHKAADLTLAPIENGILICPKHKWKFDLADGGRCINKPFCSINARVLDW